jgi:hypothetical protein
VMLQREAHRPVSVDNINSCSTRSSPVSNNNVITSSADTWEASISALSPPCVHNNPRARLREYGRATPKTREASGGRTEAAAGIAWPYPR